MGLSTFVGGRFWGRRYGLGPPWVLALHGWGRDHHDFDPLLEGLDAIAVDLPGFGVAPGPPSAWSTTQYAEALRPLVEEMASQAGGEVVVLGHSFGARVAVQLANNEASAQGPRLISALVLAGAPLSPAPGSNGRRRRSNAPLAYRIGRALSRAGLVPEERMEKLRQKFGSPDYKRATPVMRAVLVKAVHETAASAYVPLLAKWCATGPGGIVELVWGELDREASPEGTNAALAAHPDVRAAVTVVPGAGHLLDGQVAKAVRDALVRHRPR